MSYLLDTNVVSEWVKPRPEVKVMSWFDNVDEDLVYLSVISLAEIRRGIEKLAPGRRRESLSKWLAQHLPERFEQRILIVDMSIADLWGRMQDRARRAGKTLSAMNGILAATAVHKALTIVTRNTADFADLNIELLNPWL